jgi:hypothetical protein
VPRENYRPAASHWQTLSHNVVSSTSRLSGIRTHNVSGDIIENGEEDVYDSSLRVYDGVDTTYNNTKIGQVNDDTIYDYISNIVQKPGQ